MVLLMNVCMPADTPFCSSSLLSRFLQLLLLHYNLFTMKLHIKLLLKKVFGRIPAGIVCLAIFFLIFGYLASRMGTANMLNTIMNNAHDLLLNTVFYLMAICVITGAIGKIFVEFGVVSLLEKI